MSTVLKKFITLKGSAVDCYNFCKKETGWPDEKIWNVMLLQFGMALGMENRKLNQQMFAALTQYAETQRESIRMQIAASRKESQGPRGRGRPVKLT